MLNRVILIGRLTRDPELKYTPSGTAVANFTLAVGRKFNKDEADFINVVCWKGSAENVAQYLRKGSLAAVEGRLQIRSYETKEGQKRRIAEVVADDVRFLDKPGVKAEQADWDSLGRNMDAGIQINIADDDDEGLPF